MRKLKKIDNAGTLALIGIVRLKDVVARAFEFLAYLASKLHIRLSYGSSVHYRLIRNLNMELVARWQSRREERLRLSIVVATYQQANALNCLLASLLCQTLQNFEVIVIHDGADAGSRAIANRYESDFAGRLRYIETAQRFNDWGHSLREIGIQVALGEYVLLTNGDNIYGPRTVECIFDAVDQYQLDVVTWNMIHSRPWPGATRLKACNPFSVHPVHDLIDMGSFAVRTTLAKAAGFRDKASDGDATYFSDVLRVTGKSVRVGKIEKTLFVHN